MFHVIPSLGAWNLEFLLSCWCQLGKVVSFVLENSEFVGFFWLPNRPLFSWSEIHRNLLTTVGILKKNVHYCEWFTCMLLNLTFFWKFLEVSLILSCFVNITEAPGSPAATTMDLFPATEKHSQVSSQNQVAMELFPQMEDSRYISQFLDISL